MNINTVKMANINTLEKRLEIVLPILRGSPGNMMRTYLKITKGPIIVATNRLTGQSLPRTTIRGIGRDPDAGTPSLATGLRTLLYAMTVSVF